MDDLSLFSNLSPTLEQILMLYFGLPLIIITTIVLLFILFGQVLLNSGGSDWFTDLAMSLTGRSRGGSAKISIVASAMFGSISGSAVSNVASTGVLTIPLMKKGGYKAQVLELLKLLHLLVDRLCLQLWVLPLS